MTYEYYFDLIIVLAVLHWIRQNWLKGDHHMSPLLVITQVLFTASLVTTGWWMAFLELMPNAYESAIWTWLLPAAGLAVVWHVFTYYLFMGLGALDPKLVDNRLARLATANMYSVLALLIPLPFIQDIGSFPLYLVATVVINILVALVTRIAMRRQNHEESGHTTAAHK